MPSFSSKIVYRMMRSFKFNQMLKRDLANNTISSTSKSPLPYMKHIADVECISIHERDVFMLRPKGKRSQHWVMYLHGGAYVHGFQSFHWRFLAYIVKKTGWNVMAPDYPLLPASSDRMMTFIDQAYETLWNRESPSYVYFMGDSAGGGLALAFSQTLVRENRPLPNRILLLSPWLDLSMQDPLIASIEPKDPILNKEALETIGQMISDDQQPSSHKLSPLNHPLNDLPPIDIFSGTYDMLYADACHLVEKGKINNLDITLYEYPSMIHTFMFFGLPESRACVKDILNILLL